MNYAVTSSRKPGFIEWLLLLISALLLLAEAGYSLWSTYTLVHMSEVLGSVFPLDSALTEGVGGLLMLMAAHRCLMRPDVALTKGMIPAVLVIPYGIWLAHDSGGSMGSLEMVREGNHQALGLLNGVGLVIVGVLVVIACLLNEQRRRYRLRGFVRR
jgi:hypothetical protein